MLAIGRAIIADPNLLLVDEPTEGLMPELVNLVGSVLCGLKELGIDILLIEHDINTVANICDRIYVMEKGKIKYETTNQVVRGNQKILLDQIGLA